MSKKEAPIADYKASEFHFSINFTIYMGETSICYCDTEERARLVVRARNGWLQTNDGAKWLERL